MIRLWILGPTACRGPDGEELAGVVRSGKRLALLSYLAVAGPGGFLRRDTLLGLLWPESDQQKARGALRQAVRHLRGELGDVLMSRGREELGLDKERFWCDVVAFEEALEAGKLEDALALYERDLLDGFYLSDAPEFERWVERRRSRLRAQAAEAAWALADRAEHPIEGGRWARQAVSLTPHDETAVRRLLTYLAERGDEIGALGEYERFEKRVHQELGLAPGTETRALAAEIRGKTRTAPAGTSVPAVEPSKEKAPDSTPRSATWRLGVKWGWRIPAGLAAGIGFALVLTLGAQWLTGRESGAITVGRAEQLTRAEGTEIDPVLSPDGSQIAYAVGPPGARHLFVRRLAGGRTVSLTRGLAGNHRWPTWSPDGERIAFVSLASDHSTSLHVVPALGGAPRRVHATETLTSLIVSPTWSPDGSRIAFTTDRLLRVLDLESGEITDLAEAWAPHSLAWSPRGDRIAFVSENSGYSVGPVQLGNIAPSSLWIVPAEGGKPVEVVGDGLLNQSPTWGPRGRHLFFVSNRSGPRDVYVLELSAASLPAGDPVRVTTHLDPLTISVSGDGRRLAYSKLSFGMNIYSAPILADGPTSVEAAEHVTRGHQVIETLSLSPDGRWLAFDSNRSGNQDIYRMPVGGGEAVRLTRHEADDFAPRWSPDGREIAFYSFRHGHRDIFVMEADGRRVTRVTSDPGSEAFPEWMPGGDALVFSHNPVGGPADSVKLHLSERQSDGSWSAPRPFADLPGSIVRWSPSGDRIAYATGGSLRLRSVSSGADRMLRELGWADLTPEWSADDSTLFYKITGIEERGIWADPLDGGEPRRILEDPAGRSQRTTFATDGERLYFLLVDALEADIWVADLEWP